MTIAEYGRHLHRMIQDCVLIEDREKRTRTAEFIVNVMAQMNPKVKESGDYRQKLWDHIFIISDFKLDVDAPYPPPSQEVLHARPRQFKNQQSPIRYRHYGKYIEQIIEKASQYPEGLKKRHSSKRLQTTSRNHTSTGIRTQWMMMSSSETWQSFPKAASSLPMRSNSAIPVRSWPGTRRRSSLNRVPGSLAETGTRVVILTSSGRRTDEFL